MIFQMFIFNRIIFIFFNIIIINSIDDLFTKHQSRVI